MNSNLLSDPLDQIQIVIENAQKYIDQTIHPNLNKHVHLLLKFNGIINNLKKNIDIYTYYIEQDKNNSNSLYCKWFYTEQLRFVEKQQLVLIGNNNTCNKINSFEQLFIDTSDKINDIYSLQQNISKNIDMIKKQKCKHADNIIRITDIIAAKN